MRLPFPRGSMALGHVLALVTLIATVPSLEGCSKDERVCRDHEPPPSFDAMSPPVSFSRQVMPLFAESCAFGSCHGSSFGSANGIYLGGNDAAAMRGRLVDVRASELPTMAFVTPGDPRNSYLMRKMDGSACLLDAQCTGGSCGESMPRNDDTLPVEQRDVVRRWIAQGAKND